MRSSLHLLIVNYSGAGLVRVFWKSRQISIETTVRPALLRLLSRPEELKNFAWSGQVPRVRRHKHNSIFYRENLRRQQRGRHHDIRTRQGSVSRKIVSNGFRPLCAFVMAKGWRLWHSYVLINQPSALKSIVRKCLVRRKYCVLFGTVRFLLSQVEVLVWRL